ncbi:MAG: UDP-2,4-diacetamido-2,4,6-trideoxy-beta-L-altropyranose hydrolase [Pseudomonadota bacterium]
MTTAPRVLFRCDAGAGIGNGHVGRCMALAEALAARGWRAEFAGNQAAGEVVAALGAGRFAFRELEDGASPAALGQAGTHGRIVVVIDHYGLDAAYETPLRSWAAAVVVLDDLADRPHDCDLLVDQTADRAAADYGTLVPPACRVMAGPANALLRTDFVRLRPQALARDPSRPVRRILVTPGGVDGLGVTPVILDGIDASGLQFAVEVVLGRRATTLNEVRRRQCVLHVDTPKMAELMARADLAVGAGGVGAYERCCLGLPSLAVRVADNQNGMISMLAAAGALVDLGAAGSLTAEAVAVALRGVVADSRARAAMAASAAAICDGRGAERVAEAMAMLI